MKKKCRKIWSKYKMPIVVAILLIVFVVVTTLVGDKMERTEVDDWIDDTKEKQYVVTLLSQTTCSHCQKFKPEMEKVIDEYGDDFKYKIFEIDLLSKNKVVYNKLFSSYDLNNHNFDGTPYLFVTYNGKFVGFIDGENSSDEIKEFLKNNGVIE